MALTQVRAKLGDTWTVLTYNEATGRYEGTLTPPGTSIHQPGGYYNIQVEATNENGESTSLSGTQYTGLRLVVKETVSPMLELVSPSPGWLTTTAPTFLFSAQDEEGGSGINPDSALAAVDGAAVPCSVTASGNRYQIAFAGQALSEGPHTVQVSISDRDGNQATASAAYTVDTVPPDLTVVEPHLRHVVDTTEAEISGYVRDETSGIASLFVDGIAVEPDSSGFFSCVVSLEVGENTITVTATDHAGISSTKEIWMMRLITDRTQADVDKVTALLSKHWSDFTEDEKTFWNGIVRGSYNTDDMNRVGVAVKYLAQELKKAGYAPHTSPKTDWEEEDIPIVSKTEDYLNNVSEIKLAVPLETPNVPADMEGFTFEEANDLEKILVTAERIFPLLELSPFYSGEIFAGEF